MLILTARDLRPLIDDLAQLEGAFQAVEHAVLQQHQREFTHVGWVDVPLASEEVFGVFLTSSPSAASVRLWDSAVRHQLHPHAALMLLLDGATAQPRALLSAAELNPLRTSVPAGVGVKHLAAPDARVLGILGSGEQARAQVRAMRHALPKVEQVKVWSPTVANRERFAAETQQVLSIPVEACSGPQEALADADVVALTTPRGSPDVAGDWFKPGALIVTVVGMSSPDLGGTAQRVVPTINRPTPLAIPARFGGGGGRPPDSAPPPAQLAEVMLGQRPARDRPDRRLVFDLAGMYAWDTPIMEWAVAWATARGVGTPIELEGG